MQNTNSHRVEWIFKFFCPKINRIIEKRVVGFDSYAEAVFEARNNIPKCAGDAELVSYM